MTQRARAACGASPWSRHQAAACDLALYAREAFADDVVAATDRSLRFTADDLIH
ncbi:MAG: hypothetical protein IPG46_04260 [Actinobacteria bacterium]|nr:hypothetical protein [Actinomycetota bacterium]